MTNTNFVASVLQSFMVSLIVYKFKKIMGRTDFSDQFQKIIIRQKRNDYDLNVMRQSAC